MGSSPHGRSCPAPRRSIPACSTPVGRGARDGPGAAQRAFSPPGGPKRVWHSATAVATAAAARPGAPRVPSPRALPGKTTRGPRWWRRAGASAPCPCRAPSREGLLARRSAGRSVAAPRAVGAPTAGVAATVSTATVAATAPVSTATVAASALAVGAAGTVAARPSAAVTGSVAGGRAEAARSRSDLRRGMNLCASDAGEKLSCAGATEGIARDGCRVSERVGERRLRLAEREEVVAGCAERVDAAGGQEKGDELLVVDPVVTEEVRLKGIGKLLRPGERLIPRPCLVLVPRASRKGGGVARVLGGERDGQPVASLDARRDGEGAEGVLGAVGERNTVEPDVEPVATVALVLVIAADAALGDRGGAVRDARRADRRGSRKSEAACRCISAVAASVVAPPGAYVASRAFAAARSRASVRMTSASVRLAAAAGGALPSGLAAAAATAESAASARRRRSISLGVPSSSSRSDPSLAGGSGTVAASTSFVDPGVLPRARGAAAAAEAAVAAAAMAAWSTVMPSTLLPVLMLGHATSNRGQGPSRIASSCVLYHPARSKDVGGQRGNKKRERARPSCTQHSSVRRPPSAPPRPSARRLVPRLWRGAPCARFAAGARGAPPPPPPRRAGGGRGGGRWGRGG